MIDGSSLHFGVLFDSVKKFNVPKYQRSYSWSIHNEDQVGQWLRDIDLVIDNGRDYFIGTTVGVINEHVPNEKYTIVDGQQRITTTYMLLHLMKTIYAESDDRNDYFDHHFIK